MSAKCQFPGAVFGHQRVACVFRRLTHSGLLCVGYINHSRTSEVEYAPPRRMGDCVGAAHGVELVQQGADMELGRVNGNAEPARYLFV